MVFHDSAAMFQFFFVASSRLLPSLAFPASLSIDSTALSSLLQHTGKVSKCKMTITYIADGAYLTSASAPTFGGASFASFPPFPAVFGFLPSTSGCGG